MKLNKKIAVAAAVGALGMAAVPAMALENEFSGIYNLGFFMSNVDTYGTTVINPKAMFSSNKTANYFDQRARVKYTAKASDDLKLVTHFELDTMFGNNASNGALDADKTILEVKNVYLDFNVGKNVNVKTGVQTVSDKFKGILYSVTDMSGINVTTKLGSVALNTGFFKVGAPLTVAGTPSTTGYNDFNIAVLDAQYNINKNANVGLAYYLMSDNTTAQGVAGAVPGTTAGSRGQVNVHTFGAYGSAKVGAATISGFAAMQSGYEWNNAGLIATAGTGKQSKSGYAANVAARIPVGPGTLKAGYLFTSGDDNRDRVDTSWYSLQHSASTKAAALTANGGSLSQYAEGGMMLLTRNLTTNSTTTSAALISNMGDLNGTGNSILTVGYDATITPKAFASVNAGVAFASKNQSSTAAGTYATNQGNGTNFKGTEINTEIGYKLYPNMTASVQAAYVFLGGYYNGCNSATVGKNAENPYTGRIMLKYAF